MKHFAIALALFASVASAAGAATTSDTAADATLICRVAGPTDHPNAAMKDSAKQLVCKPFSIAMKMSDGSMKVIGSVTASSAQSGPDISKSLTPQQVNDAWVHYVETTFHISHSS